MKRKKFRNKVILLCFCIAIDFFTIGVIIGIIINGITVKPITDESYIDKDYISGYSVNPDGVTLYVYDDKLEYEIKCDKK